MTTRTPNIVTIRPPPHRGYLSGYCGVPASAGPSDSSAPPSDALLSLPVLLRPQAFLSGTVEIRTVKGGTRAKWLRVELEKLESVPAPPSAISSTQTLKGKEGKFVELIGSGPGTLWESKRESGETNSVHLLSNGTKKVGGVLGGLRRKSGENDEDDEGFESIPSGDYPFKIPLPEGLPPSTQVDTKFNGVSYQLVATLCTKGKKGLLKSGPKHALLVASDNVLLLKADNLPSWPIYSPIHLPPLPANLPWENTSGGPTTGETKHVTTSVRGDETSPGEIYLSATRERNCFGPGDVIQLAVKIESKAEKAIKLTRLDFVLRETLTFRYPASSGHTFRGTPRITSIFAANASVSRDPENPSAFAILHQNEPLTFNLSGTVPNSHTRVTVRTAKHVTVEYHFKVRAMLEGGEEISIDGWPVLLGHVGIREAKSLMEQIGWVNGLCERYSEQVQPITAASAPQPQPQQNVVPNSNQILSTPPRNDSLPSRTNFENNQQPQQPQQNGADGMDELIPITDYSDGNTAARRLTFGQSTVLSSEPSPVDPQTRFQHATILRRDLIESGLAKRPEERTQAENEALDALLNGTASATTAGEIDSAPTVARAHLTPNVLARSNTTIAFSGSVVTSSAERSASTVVQQKQPTSPPPPAVSRDREDFPLLRSQTILSSAEQEKKRLFAEAKEIARKRQEEARLQLERESALLASLEQDEEEILKQEVEAIQRAEEDEARLKIEMEREREKFEAEQTERAKLAEENWRKQQEFERERARNEFEQRVKQQEMARQAALREGLEQQRLQEEARKAEAAKVRQRREEEEKIENEHAQRFQRKKEETRLRAEEDERRRQQMEAQQQQQYQEQQQWQQQAQQQFQAQHAPPHQQQNYFPAPSNSNGNNFHSPTNQNLANGNSLARSGSVATFAPTTNLNDATTDFYASAIANSTLNEDANLAQEKTRYIQQLRHQDSQRRAGLPVPGYQGRVFSSPPPLQQPQALFAPPGTILNAYNPQPNSLGYGQPPKESRMRASSDSYNSAAPQQNWGNAQTQQLQQIQETQIYPQPQKIPQRPSNFTQRQETTNSFVTAPAQTPAAVERNSPSFNVHASAPVPSHHSTQYKTAYEEKQEEEARRREMDRNASGGANVANTGAVNVVATAPEEDSLPSYPVPNSRMRSAAEEKAELGAYRQAVEAVQQFQANRPPPPPVPQVHPTARDQAHIRPPAESIFYASSIIDAYNQPQASAPPETNSPPSSIPGNHSQHYLAASISSSGGISSEELSRDPEISKGKRPATSARSASASGSFGEAAVNGYNAHMASAPMEIIPQGYEDTTQYNNFQYSQNGSNPHFQPNTNGFH